MNRRSLGFWLVVAFLFSFSGSALALTNVFPSSNINGTSGLIRIPSADIVPYKNFNVGGNYLSAFNSGVVSAEAAFNYFLNLGAYHGLELGVVGGTDQLTKQMREGVFLNAKLSLSTGDEPYPLLLALGIENLFSRTQTDVYMVATKYFKQGPKLTFGFMADFPNNKFRPMGMLGAEFPLSENIFILADSMAGEQILQLNAGARVYFTPLLSLSASALNVLNGAQAKDPQSVVVSFNWANPF